MEDTPKVILGVDPSTVSTGWAIMDGEGHLIDYDAIRCSSKIPVYIRVYTVYRELLQVAHKYKITEVAVEDQFMRNNPKTLKALSNVKATVMLIAAELEVPYMEYAPMSIKKCFTDNGTASKEDMIAMARERYQIDEDIVSDIADAIGIAYTHLTIEREDLITKYVRKTKGAGGRK
jgi:crossover junction endodeoxyribonuclease RuvC